ncbi:hypothetical protein EC396_10770 [Lutibacter sp. HS1-25]|uniref:hypothetical protein n=1 Tax=Lutibacter sp. HS1-25 TaxID=2485000 RepID=UPI001011B74D|nr:hypothetical protein [Lutibacter sp. HS1-25]RXP52918.1 hypothetical protein EC396_10770 [Lutibacter sp. HS1-25]
MGYKFYNYLKGKCNIRYKGIPLNKIITYDLLILFESKEIPKYSLKQSWQNSKVIEIDENFIVFIKCENIISYSIDRIDYSELILDYKNEFFNNSKIFKINLKKIKLSARFFKFQRLKTEFNFLFTKVFLFFKFLKDKSLTSSQVNWLVSRITSYKNTIDYYEKIMNSNKIVLKNQLTFNSSFYHESILSLVLKKHKVRTISMVHGVYVKYKEFVPLDIINYENVCASEVWTWSKSTHELFKTYNPSTLLIEKGNPKYHNLCLGSVKIPKNNCIILLGRKIYEKANHSLCEILISDNIKMMNLKFSLKLHPSLNENNYSKYNLNIIKDKTVNEIIGLFDFSISINTSAYIESYVKGIIGLRYVAFENELFLGFEKDKFKNDIELIECVKYFKSLDKQEIIKITNEVSYINFNCKPYKI